jgi:hypothetical protein
MSACFAGEQLARAAAIGAQDRNTGRCSTSSTLKSSPASESHVDRDLILDQQLGICAAFGGREFHVTASA